MPELRSETMTVNMGPQHPSTHGVLRLVLELDGETVVVSADTTIGYLHTGIEKTAEQKKWQQVIPLVERMDYLGAQSNSLAFCLSVEQLLGVEMPERVQRHPRADRRAAAHHQPSRLARHARPRDRRRLGDDVLLPRARAAAQHQRDARRLPDVPELPAHRRPARGPAARLPRGGQRRSSIAFPGKLDEYEDLLTKNQIWLKRTQGVGVITQDDAIGYGLVGPIARAAGVRYDVRKTFPYLGYETYDFDVPTGAERRRLRPLPGARRGDAPEHARSAAAGARRASRRAASTTSRTTASCRRRRTRSTPRWKR